MKLAVVAAVAGALAVAYRLGVFRNVGDPSQMARALVDLGPWGYVAFVLTYAVVQPFGVPGMVFVLAAPLIWPWPIAFALSMTGTMAASVIGFSFARLVARDWVRGLVPARFLRYEAALAERAFTTVFLLRLIFWMPQVLHIFFGVSRVRFWTHFWGSLLGYVPPLLLCSYFGQSVFEAMRTAPAWAWVGAACVIALAWLAAYAVHRRRAAATGSSGSSTGAPSA